MSKILDSVNVQHALKPQAISTTNVTGSYYGLSEFGSLCAIAEITDLAVDETVTLSLVEATDRGGTGVQAISGASAVVTGNVNVSEITVALATVLNGESITINGLEFTAHTDTTTASSRQFKIDGNDTADASALAGLINDGTYGVPGVTAIAATGTITLTSTEPGKTPISASSEDATFTITTTRAFAVVEIDDSKCDLADNYDYVAPKITTVGDPTVGVIVLRGTGRHGDKNNAGAWLTRL